MGFDVSRLAHALVVVVFAQVTRRVKPSPPAPEAVMVVAKGELVTEVAAQEHPLSEHNAISHYPRCYCGDARQQRHDRLESLFAVESQFVDLPRKCNRENGAQCRID